MWHIRLGRSFIMIRLLSSLRHRLVPNLQNPARFTNTLQFDSESESA